MTLEERIAELKPFLTSPNWEDWDEKGKFIQEAKSIIEELSVELKIQDEANDILDKNYDLLKAENKELKEARDNYKRMWLGTEWQPIETAPQEEGILIFDGERVAYAYFDTDAEKWFYHDYPDNYNLYTLTKPSHWMPLPEKPINKE